MTTLFIGRFQPFHNGHLHDIRNSLKFSDKIIIAIGSSQEKNTHDNPFSYDERKEMIEHVLKKNKFQNVDIVAIPDIHDEKRWAEYVISVIGKFDIVYTGNRLVHRLFKEKGYEVREVDMVKEVNATKIRQMIDKGGYWESMVPPEVSEVIKKLNGVNRIRELDGKL